MTATKVARKTCPKCFRHLPRDEFRFLNKAKNLRASECKSCRNARLRTQRAAKRFGILREMTSEIRRAETAERVLLFVEGLFDRLGGVARVMSLWTDLIQSTDTPAASRVKAMETAIIMSATASREVVRSQSFEAIDPVEFAEFLRERKQLVPMIRALLNDGVITLDDIDPPPWADGFES